MGSPPPTGVFRTRELALLREATSQELAAEERRLVLSWPGMDRRLGHLLPPVQYADETLLRREGRDALLSSYDESIRFYEALIADGHDDYRLELQMARANCERVERG